MFYCTVNGIKIHYEILGEGGSLSFWFTPTRLAGAYGLIGRLTLQEFLVLLKSNLGTTDTRTGRLLRRR